MNIYVGNLNLKTSGRDLEEAFLKYGRVLSARVAADSTTGRPRGFGFVEMVDRLEAKAAIAGIHGTQLLGNRLIVNESEPLEGQHQTSWPFGIGAVAGRPVADP